MQRPTGPITLFATNLFGLASQFGVDFLQLHAWTGISVGCIMVLIALTDTCWMIKYCGPFTQSIFGCFVSVIFISMGIANMQFFFDRADQYGYDACFYMLVIMIMTFYIAQVMGCRDVHRLPRHLPMRTVSTEADMAHCQTMLAA